MSTAVTGSSARCRALVPRIIASVLSGFRDNPLVSSQRWTERTQSVNVGKAGNTLYLS